MSDSLLKLVVDCSTGAEVYEPLSDEEIADRERLALEADAEREAFFSEMQAKAEAKASATAKLAALGLTADEIAALS